MTSTTRIHIAAIAALLASAGALTELNATEPAWLAPSIGPLTPSVHFNAAVGDSTADHVEDLGVGHHDPSRTDGSVQGLELGASLRLGSLEGFATYVLVYGAEEEWEDEWEEAFLKLRDLPGGFEIRGGRMLGRFGQHNDKHLHAWDFVDTPLPLGAFFGDHGLWYEAADLTWINQGVANTFGATIGYGEVILHGGHGEEHAGDEEDHDEGEEHHDEHGMAFGDHVLNARLFSQLRQDDFRILEPGLSLAVGDAEDDRRIAIYGLDFTYAWRENGLEPGGRALTWTTEFFYRDIEKGHAGHEDEHEDHDEDEEHHDEEMLAGGGEFGFYSDVVYTLNQRFDVGARISYVEGNDELETEERYRVSPMITAYLDPYRRAEFRLQYNYDDLGRDDEHTVWAQVGLSWGGGEVR